MQNPSFTNSEGLVFCPGIGQEKKAYVVGFLFFQDTGFRSAPAPGSAFLQSTGRLRASQCIAVQVNPRRRWGGAGFMDLKWSF